MLFNSFQFFDFLIVVLILYYLTRWPVVQIGVLVMASLYFYGAKDPKLVWLLVLSIGMNAVFSWLGQSASRGKFWRILGVVANLSLLAAFKYGPLFLPEETQKLPLPIGISFFTFEGIMILLDRPARRLSFSKHLGRVSLLMSFFPHLVSGPIVKAGDFFPQVGAKRFRDIDWELAFRTLTVGYFLKLVVADNLRQQSNTLVFPQFTGYSTLQLLVLLLCYSAQIFSDFAGYSLIAIGLAALFGYRLPENFNYPYLATSFSEFWRRWHITLSTFLREYLYVPLGGNRHGKLRTYLNILIVMGLGGLWHGAAWSYAVWGLMHGLALVVERMLPRLKGLRPLKLVLVFSYVSWAWLLFKMPDFEHVVAYLKCLRTNLHNDTDRLAVFSVLTFSLPVLVYHLKELYYPRWLRRHDYLIYGTLLFLILTNTGPAGDFIYFQF